MGVGRTKPDWVRVRIPGGGEYPRVRRVLDGSGLRTVCLDARCPNSGECFNAGTVTFLIMGGTCTRNCGYCAIARGVPALPDPDEPASVARSVAALGLRYAVITSVTRDDLTDGGASLFARTIREIRARVPECGIEVLVPDFAPEPERPLDLVIEAVPDVINHNIEVVRPLFGRLRPGGDYSRSLRLLAHAAQSGIPAKSGLMIGFGEETDDIRATLADLRATGCSRVTIGQYLQSRKEGFPVAKYYDPGEFAALEIMAREIGFERVNAGPLVRSSYHAALMERNLSPRP